MTTAYDARDLVDSFYAGMRHAEAVIRRMREGEPHALAVEHANLRQAILRLHRPDYTAGGQVYEHTVMVASDDLPADHVCRVGVDSCAPEYDEHWALACKECRVFGDDAEVTYYALWPCSTARLVMDASGESGASDV